MVLYGAGGHAKVIAELAELNYYEELTFCEDEPTKKQIWNYPIVAKIGNKEKCVIAIGNNAVRKKLAIVLKNAFVTLIHPQSQISTRAMIGNGTVIMAGVTINTDAQVGNHCIVNTNASIDHDCIIEDFVHLSPNVALAGTVSIGEGTHIGVGACVIQGIKVGKWCTIGAGAVIIRDVPDGCTVVGNPGRIIKK
ncbi:acetyltransferase [Sphingobacterium athyrii]|uniref:Acetyltransferase n=1 Tax=Sphingobacterium athyrii TaxID=2152717 RepID=A0A363NR16_9SPHI|nr:acetyltransferase [Sphingobacterium athyrii]